MTDKEQAQTSQVSDGEDTSQQEPEVDLSQYVSVDQFREFQSKKDRETAAAERRARAAEVRLQQQQEEFLQMIEDQPELKANFDLVQMKAKAAQYDRLQEENSRISQAKRQAAQMFDLSEDALAEATTPQEAFTLARRLDRENLMNELKSQLGIQPESEEEEESSEAPEVSIGKSPPPNATLVSEEEWQRKLGELRDLAKDPELRQRDRKKARIEYAKLQGQRPRRSRRPQV